MTWTKQRQKGTTFKVQLVAIANPLYIDMIQQCPGTSEPTETCIMKVLESRIGPNRYVQEHNTSISDF